MQIGFAPKKNAAHRLACLSLYRSLLQTCTKLPFPSQSDGNNTHKSPSNTLQALIRYRFRQDRKFQNWQQIRDALHFGRRAGQLISQAADGSVAALEQMTEIIAATKGLASQASDNFAVRKAEKEQAVPPPKLVAAKQRETILADPKSYARQENTVPVLDRPVPYEQALKHKDGRRRVPHYFVANGVPILRYTRTQPLALGRLVENMIQRNEELWNKLNNLDESLELAKAEDMWDEQLKADHNIQHRDPTSNGSEPDWSYACYQATKEIRNRLHAKDAYTNEYGAKLWEVYLKEKALAETENTKRKIENRRRWQEENT